MNPPFQTQLTLIFSRCQQSSTQARDVLPRGNKWEVRTIYISPVCLAKLFTCEAEAFAQGKKEADADTWA